ncbi:hypothetical protein SOV_13100 [Sporomusa ovata DSM 2662]|nr:hypothetical protein SOV_1c06460 [Sporomusa ovata DSM 2662]
MATIYKEDTFYPVNKSQKAMVLEKNCFQIH